MKSIFKLYLAHENSAESDPVIMLFMATNQQFTAVYGIITGSLFAEYS